MDLPRFVLLKSNANNKYLCYTKEKPNHTFLSFSHEVNEKKADDEESSNSEKIEFNYLKFEVEKAKTVQGLIHIRSCYNNKYWTRKSVDNNYIAAEANEPEEDQSKWSCTLFKPIILDSDPADNFLPLCNSQKIRLLHVGQSCQRPVLTSKSSDDESVFHLAVGGNEDAVASPSDNSDSSLVFTAIGIDATALLPEYATFMGHNDKYAIPGSPYNSEALYFNASDVGGTGVAQTIDPPNILEGVTIKDQSNGYTWYIHAYDKDVVTERMAYSFFFPIKVNNYIALYSIGDGFVSCDCARGHTLVASASTIDEFAKLRVGEPVLMREIADATYDLQDSRVYNTTSVEKFSDSRSNHTDVEQEGSFQVEYTTSQTMTWNQSISVNIGVSVSWSAGIPCIGELGVDISYEHDETWEWGQEKTESKTVTYSQNITIPPGKKVTLKVVAQKALCDVPFTCKVRDLMTDGNTREYTKTDGLFTGCNEFKFDTDLIPEDL